MQRVFLPPHKLPDDYAVFLDECSPQERSVHNMAIKFLGSSYFMEKSHGYLAWKEKKVEKKKG